MRYALSPLILGLLLASCSCGERSNTDRDPRSRLDLEVDPSGAADYLLDFGAVLIGTGDARSVTVDNLGSAPLVMTSGTVSTPFEAEAPPSGLRVEPGASRSLLFRFRPSRAGAETTVVAFATNERKGSNSYTVRLQGLGVAPALDCVPPTLDFGAILQGRERTLSIRCRNPLSVPLEVSIGRLRGNAASSFSVTLAGGVDGARVLQSEEEVEVGVRFRAISLGQNDASFALVDENAEPLATISVLAQTVLSTLQLSPTTCLDFGYVPRGQTAQLAFQATNVGTNELQIEDIVVPERARLLFSTISPLPLAVPAGTEESTEILVEYHPITEGRHTTEIELIVDDGSGTPTTIRACLMGVSSRPRLECDEGPIDFGPVAIGLPLTRSFQCTNVGEVPDEGDVDPLIIEQIASEHPSFRATIRNPDGTRGPKRSGYTIGEGFQVDVVYEPAIEGNDAGAIVITSAGAGGERRVLVIGDGRELPPCEFTITPPQLQFGITAPDQELTKSFGITNGSASACLIHDLQLSSDSSPAFAVEEIESFELPGHATLEIPVTFAPTSYQAGAKGAVQFQISDPDHPIQSVPLRGSSGKSCLHVEPNPIDFGIAIAGCSSRDGTISIRNTCNGEVEVTGVEISDSLNSDEFQLIRRPLVPFTLDEYLSVDFTMRYSPKTVGRTNGAIGFTIGGSTERYEIQMTGEGVLQGSKTDVFTQKDLTKVDILFVIDNSSSMEAHQAQLQKNLPAFSGYAMSQGIDFHIGVTTTGIEPFFSSGVCPGGADGAENGRLFPINGSETGHPRILTRFTPNLSEAWKYNMNVGICHGVEQALEGAYQALQPQLLASVKDPRYRTPWDDGNAGFLRHDALLSIIFVTDASDLSSLSGRSPGDYLSFFRSVKSGAQYTFTAHGITGPKYSGVKTDCLALPGDPTIFLIEATGGVWMDICTSSDDDQAWSRGLQRMAAGAFGFTDQFVLSGQPGDTNGDRAVDASDITLTVDGVELPPLQGSVQAWRYDALKNAIIFTPLYVPKPGSQLSATYELGCPDH